MSDTKTLQAAKLLTQSGISVIPTKPDSKSPALTSWKQWQHEIAPEELLERWFHNGNGISWLMGAISGNAGLIDFDKPGLYDLFSDACKDNMLDDIEQKCVLIQTPRDGRHIVFRCDQPEPGNQKLARSVDGEVLIETRGEGGYARTCPTPGYKLLRGDPTNLPLLTAEERYALKQVAKLFDEFIHDPEERTENTQQEAGNSPGDDYSLRGDYEAVLEKYGWRRLHRHGERQTWTRPGKEVRTVSATTGYAGRRMLYVFSSNGLPFEPDRKYSPFAVYTMLEHGTDTGAFARAASQLGRDGFGEPAAQHKTRVRGKRLVKVETEEEKEKAEEPDAKWTEFELAKFWARRMENQFLWVEGEQWWRYSGNVWRYSSSAKARQCVQLFLEEAGCVTPAKVRNVLFLAESELGPVEMSSFDAQQLWIPLANGVYDISSGQLLPHDPLHRLTHIVPYEYDERAECPTWRQCLNEWMLTDKGQTCQEWIDILQEFFGYCLIPDTRAQVSMLWNGEGGNGKGVATRVLEGLVGRDYTTAIAVEQLHDPYQRAEIQGKLVGFVNEPDPKAMQKNGNHFKAIVGGDPINARRPTEKVFTFKPVCRVIISTNELPSTRDTSIGYYRRLIMIDWRYNVPADRRDQDLDDKLRQELPGIFNWALEGLRRFRERRKFEIPEESRLLLEGYRKENDPIGRYFKEELVFDVNAWASAKTLYHNFKRWSETIGIRIETDTAFGKRLSKVGCIRSLGTVDGQRVRGWKGVREISDVDMEQQTDEEDYSKYK